MSTQGTPAHSAAALLAALRANARARRAVAERIAALRGEADALQALQPCPAAPCPEPEPATVTSTPPTFVVPRHRAEWTPAMDGLLLQAAVKLTATGAAGPESWAAVAAVVRRVHGQGGVAPTGLCCCARYHNVLCGDTRPWSASEDEVVADAGHTVFDAIGRGESADAAAVWGKAAAALHGRTAWAVLQRYMTAHHPVHSYVCGTHRGGGEWSRSDDAILRWLRTSEASWPALAVSFNRGRRVGHRSAAQLLERALVLDLPPLGRCLAFNGGTAEWQAMRVLRPAEDVALLLALALVTEGKAGRVDHKAIARLMSVDGGAPFGTADTDGFRDRFTASQVARRLKGLLKTIDAGRAWSRHSAT